MLAAVAAVTLLAAQPAELSARQAERLSAASERALTDPRGAVRARRVGGFETPLGEARAFRTEYRQGSFIRRMIVLISPEDPDRGPATVMVTSNATVDQIAAASGQPKPFFVDLYTCGSHATLDMLTEEPTVEALQALLERKLQPGEGAISSTTPQNAGPCPYAAFVFPGLEQGGR
jgi:hypothetical protein